MTNTPDTDANQIFLGLNPDEGDYFVPAEIARQLEQQRNEAVNNYETAVLREHRMEEQRDKWKANHDNQVAINRLLRDRPDMGERAKLVDELIQQRDWYKAACDKYSEDETINTLCSLKEQRDDAIVEATNAVNDIISVRWKLKHAEETAERYRLDANRLEAEVMMLKEKLKEYDDTLTVCTDNFSCKTFVPQKWELPPYDKQGKGTPIE